MGPGIIRTSGPDPRRPQVTNRIPKMTVMLTELDESVDAIREWLPIPFIKKQSISTLV